MLFLTFRKQTLYYYYLEMSHIINSYMYLGYNGVFTAITMLTRNILISVIIYYPFLKSKTIALTVSLLTNPGLLSAGVQPTKNDGTSTSTPSP